MLVAGVVVLLLVVLLLLLLLRVRSQHAWVLVRGVLLCVGVLLRRQRRPGVVLLLLRQLLLGVLVLDALKPSAHTAWLTSSAAKAVEVLRLYKYMVGSRGHTHPDADDQECTMQQVWHLQLLLVVAGGRIHDVDMHVALHLRVKP